MLSLRACNVLIVQPICTAELLCTWMMAALSASKKQHGDSAANLAAAGENKNNLTINWSNYPIDKLRGSPFDVAVDKKAFHGVLPDESGSPTIPAADRRLPELPAAFSAKLSTIHLIESSAGVSIASHRRSPTTFKGWLAAKRMRGAGTMWAKRFIVIRLDAASMYLYESDPVLALLRFHVTVPVLQRVSLAGASAKRANVDDLVGCPTQHVRPLGLELATATGPMVFGLVCASDFPDAWLKALGISAAQAVQPLRGRRLQVQRLHASHGPPTTLSCKQRPHDHTFRPQRGDEPAQPGAAEQPGLLLRGRTWERVTLQLQLQLQIKLLLLQGSRQQYFVDLSNAVVTASSKEAAFADLPVLHVHDRRLGSRSGCSLLLPSHACRLDW